MKKSIYISLLFSITLICCTDLQWDLPFEDILTANRKIENPDFIFAPTFSIPYQDDKILTAGLSPLGSIVLHVIDFSGQFVQESTAGRVQSLSGLELNGEQVFLISNDENTNDGRLILFDLNKNEISENISFKEIINSQIGSVDKIALYSIQYHNNFLLITGALTQSIGNPRGMLIKYSIVDKTVDFITFNENVIYNDIAVDSESNIVISGFDQTNFIYSKLNLDLEFLFPKINIENVSGDKTTKLVALEDGSVAMAYSSPTFNVGELQLTLNIFDSSGSTLFSTNYGAMQSAFAAIDKDDDGNLILGGTLFRDQTESSVQLVKVNSLNHELIFMETFDSFFNIQTSGLGHTQDCGYYFMGIYDGFSSGDLHFIKTDHVAAVR